MGKPLPCVLVSTFPQCTATWLSLCSTVLQYSCCQGMEGGRGGGRGRNKQSPMKRNGSLPVQAPRRWVSRPVRTHLHLGGSGLLVKAHGHGVAGYPEEVCQRHRFPLRTQRALKVTPVASAVARPDMNAVAPPSSCRPERTGTTFRRRDVAPTPLYVDRSRTLCFDSKGPSSTSKHAHRKQLMAGLQ